jgi:[ribosomal protein S5]-alanine N-acetyltransferase
MDASLATARLIVRVARNEDAAELLAYHERNREHLRPWEPDPPPDFFSLAYWERFAAGAGNGEESTATRMRFIVCEPDRPNVVGSVNLQSIERGVASRAVLGYSLDASFAGRGYAREAVGGVVDFAFATLRLHRIEANYQPANERSGKLLRALGFVVEGYARDYLFLNGAWRDHILTSRTNPA